MTWNEIKEQFKRLGITNRELAVKWHTSEGSVSRLLNGELRSERLTQALAELLGIPVSDIPDAVRCPACHRKFRKAS